MEIVSPMGARPSAFFSQVPSAGRFIPRCPIYHCIVLLLQSFYQVTLFVHIISTTLNLGSNGHFARIQKSTIPKTTL